VAQEGAPEVVTTEIALCYGHAPRAIATHLAPRFIEQHALDASLRQ
jgi:hypothetical protein